MNKLDYITWLEQQVMLYDDLISEDGEGLLTLDDLHSCYASGKDLINPPEGS